MAARTQGRGQAAPPPVDPRATRDVVVVAFASFLLIGWHALLIPSLIRQVQGTFEIDDPGMGLAYLLGSALYVAGTVVSGTLVSRVPRRLLLAAGPALMAIGLVGEAWAPAWGLFLAGFLVANLGGGIVDAGVNALAMAFLMAPINLSGLLLGPILPANRNLYLDNVALAHKPAG